MELPALRSMVEPEFVGQAWRSNTSYENEAAVIFVIRDRASGWYLTHSPMRRDTGGFELVKGKVFALPLLAEGRDAERQAQTCCDVASNLFGENKANGFELFWEKIA